MIAICCALVRALVHYISRTLRLLPPAPGWYPAKGECQVPEVDMMRLGGIQRRSGVGQEQLDLAVEDAHDEGEHKEIE
jgi:hypothetical protein